MVKVCMVGLETLPIPPVSGGAIERGILEILPFLAEMDVSLDVISIFHEDISESLLKKYAYANFHFIKIPKLINVYPFDRIFKGLYFFSKAAGIVSRIRPDIVHFRNYPGAVFIINSFSKKVKFKNVITFHNMDYGWNFLAKRMDRFLFSPGLKMTNLCIAVSDYIKNHVLDRYGNFVKNKIITIYDGVNVDIFKPKPEEAKALKKQLGMNDYPILLFVGRIDPRKGVHILLDAFVECKKRRKALQLLVVGPKGSFWHKKPQDYAVSIEARIRSIEGAFLMNPTYDVEKLAIIYSMADIACFPSICKEGFGLVSVEAQACGVPVLVTNLGGLRETFLEGETGFSVKEDDCYDLADKIEYLISNVGLRKKMSAKARSFIVEDFSWKNTAINLVGAYKRLLAHE